MAGKATRLLLSVVEDSFASMCSSLEGAWSKPCRGGILALLLRNGEEKGGKGGGGRHFLRF